MKCIVPSRNKNDDIDDSLKNNRKYKMDIFITKVHRTNYDGKRERNKKIK